VRLVVLLLALGFPIALILAWAFELTPEGIQLTASARAEGAMRKRMRRPLFWSLIGLGAIAALSLSFHLLRPGPVPSAKEAGQSPGRRAVAVLPFENLSEDKANAYFADGIQDEIITRLAKIGELKVISRSSTQRYRSKGENVTEIARQLGVAPVVEGSVQKVGDRVRINIQGSGRRARAEDDLPIGTRARSS
jgi:TolB-like protein